jgi:ABC-2 type transport system ATP-binding protein
VTGREGTATNGEGRVAAVKLSHVGYAFGDLRAVDDVSFDIEQGEIFGLLGPNGAGKTTTIRMLITLLRPDTGSLSVFGFDTGSAPMRVRRLLGYVPQQLSIDAQLTGWENVWLFARLFDVPSAERNDRIEQAMTLVGLGDVAPRMASTYSGGMIRRLELAQALVNRPRLLVLDEPTIGLDPIARRSVWERVLELREELNMTVLLTTHYMEEADELCDRVALMHHGTLRALGRPDELKAALGPGASLDDVFTAYAGGQLDTEGNLRDVRSTRRTIGRVG